jgi:hypothetical protein
MPELRLALALPDWVTASLPPAATPFESLEQRMDFVIRLAEQNVRRDTGGPFAAAVFDEGDKPAQWPKRLAERGIAVIQDGRRADAVEVLAAYVRGQRPDLKQPQRLPGHATTSRARRQPMA